MAALSSIEEEASDGEQFSTLGSPALMEDEQHVQGLLGSGWGPQTMGDEGFMVLLNMSKDEYFDILVPRLKRMLSVPGLVDLPRVAYILAVENDEYLIDRLGHADAEGWPARDRDQAIIQTWALYHRLQLHPEDYEIQDPHNTDNGRRFDPVSYWIPPIDCEQYQRKFPGETQTIPAVNAKRTTDLGNVNSAKDCEDPPALACIPSSNNPPIDPAWLAESGTEDESPGSSHNRPGIEPSTNSGFDSNIMEITARESSNIVNLKFKFTLLLLEERESHNDAGKRVLHMADDDDNDSFPVDAVLNLEGRHKIARGDVLDSENVDFDRFKALVCGLCSEGEECWPHEGMHFLRQLNPRLEHPMTINCATSLVQVITEAAIFLQTNRIVLSESTMSNELERAEIVIQRQSDEILRLQSALYGDGEGKNSDVLML